MNIEVIFKKLKAIIFCSVALNAAASDYKSFIDFRKPLRYNESISLNDSNSIKNYIINKYHVNAPIRVFSWTIGHFINETTVERQIAFIARREDPEGVKSNGWGKYFLYITDAGLMHQWVKCYEIPNFLYVRAYDFDQDGIDEFILINSFSGQGSDSYTASVANIKNNEFHIIAKNVASFESDSYENGEVIASDGLYKIKDGNIEFKNVIWTKRKMEKEFVLLSDKSKYEKRLQHDKMYYQSDMQLICSSFKGKNESETSAIFQKRFSKKFSDPIIAIFPLVKEDQHKSQIVYYNYSSKEEVLTIHVDLESKIESNRIPLGTQVFSSRFGGSIKVRKYSVDSFKIVIQGTTNCNGRKIMKFNISPEDFAKNIKYYKIVAALSVRDVGSNNYRIEPTPSYPLDINVKEYRIDADVDNWTINLFDMKNKQIIFPVAAE